MKEALRRLNFALARTSIDIVRDYGLLATITDLCIPIARDAQVLGFWP